jgi:hypothetical protein
MIICPTRSWRESDANVLSTQARWALVNGALGFSAGAGIGIVAAGIGAVWARVVHAAARGRTRSRSNRRNVIEHEI